MNRYQIRRTIGAMMFAIPTFVALPPILAQTAGSPPTAVATRDTIEIRLPLSPIDSLGCPVPQSSSTNRKPERGYSWIVMHDFANASYPNNHWMSFMFTARAPLETRWTAKDLEAALNSERVVVRERVGEPAFSVDSVQAPQASVRIEDGMLRIRLEGAVAVAAFLKAGTDRLRISWCESSRPPTLRLTLQHR